MANIKIKGTKVKYFMNDRLEYTLKEKIKPLMYEKDEDCVIAVDGQEGSGKSTLALQIGRYIDPTLDLNRVVFNAEDFRQKVLAAKKRQCVIFDEEILKHGVIMDSAPSGFRKITEGQKIARDKHYKILRKKQLFLARLENKLGKGTTWDNNEEDEID